MNEPEWITDLFKEKSLWATFVESGKFPTTPFNRRCHSRIFPLTFATCVILCLSFAESNELLRGIDAASYLLASIAATILGFLVAGLAIFTTLSDKRILIVLAQTPQKGTGVTTFKYLYYNLLRVFVIYIALLIISFAVQVVSKMGVAIGPIEMGGILFPLSLLWNGLVLPVLAVGFLEATLVLKTFIWNIYATFLSVLTVSTVID